MIVIFVTVTAQPTSNNNHNSNHYTSPEARDLLKDVVVLPNQVRRVEVDNALFTNSTPISFFPPLVETVEEDDDIICERPLIDKDKVINMFENYIIDHDNTVHVVDAYANEYYVNGKKVDTTFFEDSFVVTREDLNTIFMIPTPKRTHRT